MVATGLLRTGPCVELLSKFQLFGPSKPWAGKEMSPLEQGYGSQHAFEPQAAAEQHRSHTAGSSAPQKEAAPAGCSSSRMPLY